MRPSFVLLIVVSVLLSSGAQLLLKHGVSALDVQKALNGGAVTEILRAIALSPMIFLGLGFFGVSVILWIFVLSKIDVSYAYPFVSLGIVVTVTAGHFLFGEALSPLRIAGVGAIVIGVLAVAFSA